MARGALVGDSRRYRATLLVSKNNDQFRAQVHDCVFDTAENRVVGDVPRNSYHEEIAQTFIKKQLGSDPRVRAAEDHGEWVLSRNQFASPARGFVRMPFFVTDKTRIPSQKSRERLVRRERGGCFLAPGAGSETEKQRSKRAATFRDGK